MREGKLRWAPRFLQLAQSRESRLRARACVYVCLLDSIVGRYQSCRQYIKAISRTQTNMDALTHTVHAHKQEHILSSPALPKLTRKKKRLGWFWKCYNNTRPGRREKCPAALEATRALLHYVYNCSVLKATSHVSCEATPRCNSAVWASSPSNINANHCSHSINIERKVQFTSDLFLMNLDGSEKNCDEYF